MEINYDVPPPRQPTLMQKPPGQKHTDFKPLEVKNSIPKFLDP